MFADFIPFKPPALAAHVYFSESDMLIIKKKKIGMNKLTSQFSTVKLLKRQES